MLRTVLTEPVSLPVHVPPVPRLRFRVHAILQIEERGLTVEDIHTALGNGTEIESRPNDQPYPSRLVLGTCRVGFLHVAVRDNIDDDEIVVETAYQPDVALWEPDLKRRRKKSR